VRICELGHRRQIQGALKHSSAFSLLLLQRELHSSGEFKQTTQYQTHLYTWHAKTYNFTDYPPLQCDQTWRSVPGRTIFGLGTPCQWGVSTGAAFKERTCTFKQFEVKGVKSSRTGEEKSLNAFSDLEVPKKVRSPRSEHWQCAPCVRRTQRQRNLVQHTPYRQCHVTWRAKCASVTTHNDGAWSFKGRRQAAY
jgi:hypothetical protein